MVEEPFILTLPRYIMKFCRRFRKTPPGPARLPRKPITISLHRCRLFQLLKACQICLYRSRRPKWKFYCVHLKTKILVVVSEVFRGRRGLLFHDYKPNRLDAMLAWFHVTAPFPSGPYPI